MGNIKDFVVSLILKNKFKNRCSQKEAHAIHEANPDIDLNPFKLEEILFGKGRD